MKNFPKFSLKISKFLHKMFQHTTVLWGVVGVFVFGTNAIRIQKEDMRFLPDLEIGYPPRVQVHVPFAQKPLWVLDARCDAKCQTFRLWQCFPLKHPRDICQEIGYERECCNQFLSTTTTTPIASSTSPTPTTSSSTLTSTTPGMTTTTNINPICLSSKPKKCSPEPGCSQQIRYAFPYTNTTSSLSWKECRLGCSEFCLDPCRCKRHAGGKCEYHVVTGQCMVRRKECDKDFFTEHACVRDDSFYASGGILCHNYKGNTGPCANATTMLAVNLNGMSGKDKRMIQYEEDDNIPYFDPYNTKRDFFANDVEIEEDEWLYGTYSSGKKNGKDPGQCLFYNTRAREVGDYELSVRTIEPEHTSIFSVTFNDVVIVPNVDLFALFNDKPVNIIANFKIRIAHNMGMGKKTKKLVITGHPPLHMNNSILRVGFCLSDCRLCPEYRGIDPSYVVSGFSILRLTGGIKKRNKQLASTSN